MKIDNAKGIPLEILARALDAARAGRETILQQMLKTLPTYRAQLKETAPRAEIISYDPERKMFLLGPGGEMLRYVIIDGLKELREGWSVPGREETMK